MKLFDEKYVHFMWKDELEGKCVFYADEVDALMRYVENNDVRCMAEVSPSTDGSHPFRCNDITWRFVYYDPRYDLKSAFKKGKQIQLQASTGEWMDIDDPDRNDNIEYRIKPALNYAIGDQVRILDGTGKIGIVTGYDHVNAEYFVAGEWFTPHYLTLL